MIYGLFRRYWYFVVRSEILGLREDKQQQKHSSKIYSLVKNVSCGIEDDQIPS